MLKKLISSWSEEKNHIEETGIKKISSVLKIYKEFCQLYIITEGGKFIKLNSKFEEELRKQNGEVKHFLKNVDLVNDLLSDYQRLPCEEEFEQDHWENCEFFKDVIATAKNAATARLEQIKAYQELLDAELELLQYYPPGELNSLKSDWENHSEQDVQEALEKYHRIKEIIKEEKPKFVEATKLYHEKLGPYRVLSDNLGKGKSTDLDVIKGKKYPIEERKINIFCENPLVEEHIQQINQKLRLPISPGNSIIGDDTRSLDEGKKQYMEDYLMKYIHEAERHIANEKPLIHMVKRTMNKLEKIMDEAVKYGPDNGIDRNILESAEGKISSLSEILAHEESKKEYSKTIQRVQLPDWQGGHEEYKSWREVHKSLNRNPDEIIRVVHLQNCIKNPEVKFMIKHAKTFNEAIRVLDERFGDGKVFVPRIFINLDKLEDTPRSKQVECKNIQSILNSMIELEEYNALGMFNNIIINRMANKLRTSTRDRWLRLAYADGPNIDDERLRESFKKFITMELHICYKINLIDDRSGKTEVLDNERKIEKKKILKTSLKEGKEYACLLCSDKKHRIQFCPFLADEKIVQTLKSKNICPRCLMSPCKGKYCGQFFHKKANKYVSGDCKHGCVDENNVPFHYKVCGCKKEKPETIKTKSNRVSKRTTIPTVGQGICLSENVFLIKKDGSKEEITILYDKGSDSSLCLDSLSNIGRILTKKNIAIEMADGGSRYITDAPVIELKIESFGRNRQVDIQALGVQQMTETKSFTVNVPAIWMKKYGLNTVAFNKEKTIHLLLGMDCNEYMPDEVDRIQGLSLYRSRITNDYIIGGYDPNCESNSSILHTARAKIDDMKDVVEMFKLATTIETIDETGLQKKLAADFMQKKKEEEDVNIKKNIVYDEENKVYIVNLLHNDKLCQL